jgi:hypothetical protein
MSETEHNRRRVTRATSDVPTQLLQGGAVWSVKLIDVSLNGLSVTQPEDWDADYSHPFNFILHLKDGGSFEAHAHLIHVESGILGFQMEHLGPEQLAPLAKLLAQKLGDEVIEAELRVMDEINS